MADDLRHPALRVTADGVPVRGAFAAQATNTNHAGADRFRARAALHADPAMGVAFWSAAEGVSIAVAFGLNGAAITPIEGLIDRVEVDLVGGVVLLEGRDRTAALIEARTSEAFANQTSSEIAMALAGRHGLGAQVMPTTTPVGRYWQLEHDRVTLDRFAAARTEWDLLLGLAAREGFDVWVRGRTLFFQPPAADGDALVVRAAAPASVSGLRLERSLTLARDIEVTVRSWNSKLAQGFTETARATRDGAGGGRSGRDLLRYSYVVPDLLPDAARALALRHLRELSAHERVIEAEMPGDLTTDVRAALRVEGTGSDWDQDYVIDEVTRRYDARGGFSQSVRARNVSCGVEIG